MTRSIDDYGLWKEETEEYYLKRFPSKKKRIKEFINYVGTRYDIHNRSYIPRQLMWYLYGKKKWLMKHNQHYWIAFIGKKGGEGKSTLANACFHFIDESYNPKRISLNFDNFIEQIPKAKKDNKYPAVLLDEPESKIHQLSKKGSELRDILERIRQLNLVVGVCANSLTSIPPFIYERLSAIVFVDTNHRFWLWDSSHDKPKETIIEDIKGKDGWGKFKHSVFKKYWFLRRAHFKNMGFSSKSPFNIEKYLGEKEDDLITQIRAYTKKNGDLKKNNKHLEGKNDRLLKEIIRMKEKENLTDGQIGIRLGLTRQWVNTLRNRDIECQEAGLHNTIPDNKLKGKVVKDDKI